MKRVFLIGCGKSKLDRPAPASQLYTGQLFRKSLAYAEAELGQRRDGEIYVLSAQYGLSALGDELQPYDLTLARMSRDDRAAWGWDVAGVMHEVGLLDEEREFVFLAGRTYVDALQEGLRQVMRETGINSLTCQAPLHGLGLGERLAWLTDQLQLRRCRVCGCTQFDCQRCIERTGRPCSWAGADLCTACQDWRAEA